MSTAVPTRPATAAPPLVEGQRLDQPTFHALYEAAPPGTRAELINGVVFMPSPVGLDHGDAHAQVVFWLGCYVEHTPGVQALDNASAILDRRNEPQPDACLRVRPASGGQSRDEGGYMAGPPELVVEVARTSRYLDLGPKFDEYERAGVREYVVFAVGPDEVLWHVLENGRFVSLAPGPDGLYRSRAFPGLWLDPQALLTRDPRRLRAAVALGLAAPEHAAFLDGLGTARAGP